MPYTLSSFSKPRTGGRTCTCSHLGWEESTCAAAPIRGASERTRPEFGCWPGSASTTLAMLVDAPLARAACAAAPCNALLPCTTTKAYQGTVNYASYVHATTCNHEVHVNHMPTVCQSGMLQHICIKISQDHALHALKRLPVPKAIGQVIWFTGLPVVANCYSECQT